LKELPVTNRSIIVRRIGQTPVDRSLGSYSLEPLIAREEQDAMTVWHVRIEPGVMSRTSHHRDAEEAYFVLAGSGAAFLDGVEHSLEPGTFLRLPPGTRHAFRAGPQGLTMLDVHAPGCWPDHDTFFENA
jgi:mannose-6-phosphate isomerase-like protein (cupin superfamily)